MKLCFSAVVAMLLMGDTDEQPSRRCAASRPSLPLSFSQAVSPRLSCRGPGPCAHISQGAVGSTLSSLPPGSWKA